MFTKESLYINAIKYDTQLKLDYKKLNENEIVETNNSVFLVNDDILPLDIALKLNSSQTQVDETYISTLLISDTTKLVPKDKSSKLKDCEIASFNNEYDIAVLKTTLFETKNFFEKTGIDFIYSAFHIMNLHIEQNVCKDEILVFLFNNKVFILVLNKNGSIVYHKIEDLPTFESIKKTHFYDDDIDGQKLFDEVYYLELSQIIQNNLTKFYEKKSDSFIEKVTILYNLKQLSVEQINSLKEELLLKVDYHPINVDEEIFELSKDKHHRKSFVKPRKKKKKTNYTNLFIAGFFLLAFFGIFKLYTSFEKPIVQDENSEIKVQNKNVKLPDHININDKIEKRLNVLMESIPYDVVLSELVMDEDSLVMKAKLLKDDTFITSLKPNLDNLYEDSQVEIAETFKDKKVNIEATITSKDFIELKDVEYKTNTQNYIVDEFFPILRVTEQLKILMPEDTIIKFKSSNNADLTKFYYLINMLVKSPKEFYSVIEILNKELYSINIEYPVSFIKTPNGLEVEFNLVFNQPK